MTVTYIRRPAGLGEPLGRYSHLSTADGGHIVHVAGQVGVLANGELAGEGSFTDQVRQAFTNVATALAAVGGGCADIVKTTTFLVGGANLEAFMEVRGQIFAELFPDGSFPPNTLLFVERLVEERLQFEIEAVAVVSGATGAELADA